MAHTSRYFNSVTGTTNGTAGTRSTHAHGLIDWTGAKLVPLLIEVQVTQSNNDTAMSVAEAARVEVVSFDDTNVVLKANQASVPVKITVVG